MTPKTEQILIDLATKFGTTAEHLWQVLTYQAFVSSMVGAIQVLVMIALIVVAFIAIRKQKKKWDDSEVFAAFIVWGFVSSIVLLIIICETGNIATGFLNPEYWALQQILK